MTERLLTAPAMFGRLLDEAYTRFMLWRARVLTSPAFHRWAARSIFTRRRASRRTDELLALATGFVSTQCLLACVRLDLFAFLREAARREEDIAAHCKLSLSRARVLLRAAEGVGLIARQRHGLFGLDELGAAVVANPGIAAMILHHQILYADLQDPIALLRGETQPALQTFWSYVSPNPSESVCDASAYSALMADSLRMMTEDILDALPPCGQHRVLDIAGGSGTFARAYLEHHPAASLTVFDLPAVAELANQQFAAQGLASRANAVGGDIFRGDLPGDFDRVFLVRVAHDHDDDCVMSLLGAARMALRPGGTLIIAEPMADTRGNAAFGNTYFGFYLMAMGSGRPRSVKELESMLITAGFGHVTELKTRRPVLVRIVVASNEHQT